MVYKNFILKWFPLFLFFSTIQCYLQDTKSRPLCIGEKYGVINNQPIRYSSSHSGGEKSRDDNIFSNAYDLGLTNNTVDRAYNGGSSLDTVGLRGFTIVKIMDKTKSINKMCSDSDDDQVIMDVIAGDTTCRFFMTDEDNTVILKSSKFKSYDPNYNNHFIYFKKNIDGMYSILTENANGTPFELFTKPSTAKYKVYYRGADGSTSDQTFSYPYHRYVWLNTGENNIEIGKKKLLLKFRNAKK